MTPMIAENRIERGDPQPQQKGPRQPAARRSTRAPVRPPVLRTLGKEPRGREANDEGENGADDGGVDEDLERRRARGQTEYRLQGVVHVGEGDEVPQKGEDAVRVLVA